MQAMRQGLGSSVSVMEPNNYNETSASYRIKLQSLSVKTKELITAVFDQMEQSQIFPLEHLKQWQERLSKDVSSEENFADVVKNLFLFIARGTRATMMANESDDVIGMQMLAFEDEIKKIIQFLCPKVDVDNLVERYVETNSKYMSICRLISDVKEHHSEEMEKVGRAKEQLSKELIKEPLAEFKQAFRERINEREALTNCLEEQCKAYEAEVSSTVSASYNLAIRGQANQEKLVHVVHKIGNSASEVTKGI